MNCVFEITLGRPLNATECVAYNGQWCQFCDEDNGGGKFCYNCGQKETDDYRTDDEDEYATDEDEDNYEVPSDLETIEDEDEDEDEDEEYDEYWYSWLK